MYKKLIGEQGGVRRAERGPETNNYNATNLVPGILLEMCFKVLRLK